MDYLKTCKRQVKHYTLLAALTPSRAAREKLLELAQRWRKLQQLAATQRTSPGA